MQRFNNIFAQNGIGFDKKLLHCFGYFLGVNLPQFCFGCNFSGHKPYSLMTLFNF